MTDFDKDLSKGMLMESIAKEHILHYFIKDSDKLLNVNKTSSQPFDFVSNDIRWEIKSGYNYGKHTLAIEEYSMGLDMGIKDGWWYKKADIDSVFIFMPRIKDILKSPNFIYLKISKEVKDIYNIHSEKYKLEINERTNNSYRSAFKSFPLNHFDGHFKSCPLIKEILDNYKTDIQRISGFTNYRKF